MLEAFWAAAKLMEDHEKTLDPEFKASKNKGEPRYLFLAIGGFAMALHGNQSRIPADIDFYFHQNAEEAFKKLLPKGGPFEYDDGSKSPDKKPHYKYRSENGAVAKIEFFRANKITEKATTFKEWMQVEGGPGRCINATELYNLKHAAFKGDRTVDEREKDFADMLWLVRNKKLEVEVSAGELEKQLEEEKKELEKQEEELNKPHH